jgi:hypothetical protein
MTCPSAQSRRKEASRSGYGRRARATGKRKFGHLTRATGNHGLFKPVRRICVTIAVQARIAFNYVGSRPILCAVLDECAFYRDENFSSPDIETYAGFVPVR